MSDAPRPNCGEPYPNGKGLVCLKVRGHASDHATCLGYHPEWVDDRGLQHPGEYEWDSWRADRGTTETGA